MIQKIVKIPNKEECEREGFPCYNCDLRSITNCIIFRDHMLEEHETSAKETSKVTYEDIKESVEELRKQKEKIERLQKEFIEEEVKRNPLFMGYYIDTEKSDGEIIKVGLPEVTVSLSPSALHYSSAPSGKIPVPSKEPTGLEFHVAAGKYLDSEWEKISLEILKKGLGLTQKDFSLEATEKASGRGKPEEKPEIPKRVLSRKVVLRENFC